MATPDKERSRRRGRCQSTSKLVLPGRRSVRSVHVTCPCDGVPPPFFPEFATRGRGAPVGDPDVVIRAVSAPGDQKNPSKGRKYKSTPLQSG